MVNNSSLSNISGAVHQFQFNDTPIGKQLADVPNNLSWYDVLDGDYRSFKFYFVDQSNQKMLNIDKDIQLAFILRQKN